MSRYQRHLFICMNERPADSPNECCASRGAEAVRTAFKTELKRRKLASVVRANRAGCLSNCSYGVSVVIYPEAVWYGGVTLRDVDEIIERHILKGEVVERLLIKEYPSGPLELPPLDLSESITRRPDDSKSD